MSDPEETPELGGFIQRGEFVDVLAILGLDPANTHSMYASADGVLATEFVLKDDGSRQVHPDDRETVWTKEVFYPLTETR